MPESSQIVAVLLSFLQEFIVFCNCWLKRPGQARVDRSYARLVALTGVLWGTIATAVVADETDVESLSFNAHIRPILNEHCLACHGGVKQAGEVSFVYPQQVLPPDGWIIEPGDPDSSILIDRVMDEDPEVRMPPPDHGRSLTETEIGLLKKWIRQGAKWEGHWAYTAPREQAVPNVKSPEWPRSPIDHFVLARLENASIEPSVDAIPERWLRRVSLDLTGLPPTPQQRESFLKEFSQNADVARRAAVDRLLASPGYGERWASVWLDQIRYADSKGLGADGRRNVWKYRDWVIQAMNDDLPFDQFTIKQIAGDLLPKPTIGDLVATTAHRLTQTNEEGGTDDEEFRIAAVLDRVNTTWQTWQGITFGCVQCHSHPYGPFRHEEYYEFAAFFNNTADCDLNDDLPVIRVPVQPSNYDRAAELDGQIADLTAILWNREYRLLRDSSNWIGLKDLKATTNNQTQIEIVKQRDHDLYRTVDTVTRNTDITLTAPIPSDINKLTAIRITVLPLNPETAIADTETGFEISHVESSLVIPGAEKTQPLEFARLLIDEPAPLHDPQESLNPKSNRGFAAYTRIHYPRQAALVLRSPVEVPEGSQLELKLKHRVFLLAAFSLISRSGHLAVSDEEQFTDLLSDDRYVQQRKQLAALQQTRKTIPSTSVPVLRERPKHLSRPTHVFIRGLFLTKADQVAPATPDSLPPLPDDLPPNRMALAQWLVGPENPLTARVAVNRVWARLFGKGIVATEEDFGSSGAPPSHPRLLDYLAFQFQRDMNWSMKNLLREIVLSRTYAQSSAIRPEIATIDPDNRLLARGPRNRLPAEVVRDQALFVSGLLSQKQFGPPVHPPLPAGVWKPFQGGDKWITPQPDDEDRYRRSIYTYTKRSIPYPMFAAFDAPSREFCAPRRLNSNTPIQALTLLNDQTFIECAQALADWMRDAGDDPQNQIRAGFLRTTCRPPSRLELQELVDLQSRFANSASTEEGLYAVAVVLLNLDEVVTK